MFHRHESDFEQRIRQVKERQARLEARNTSRVVQELLQKRKHCQSWIRPWLHACRHIRAYLVHERKAIFHNYIPLKKLPQSLLKISHSKLVTPTKQLRQRKRPIKELGTPLSVFSTSADQSESGLSQLKVTSPKKGKSQLFPKSLFTSSIGHGDSRIIIDSGPSFREPIVSIEGTNSETNSLVRVLDKVLVDTMATLTTVPSTVLVTRAVPGPLPAPVRAAGPDVPIAIQMGAIEDCTTSIAPLPTVSRCLSADPDQHLSQFLTAYIANNGRMKDVWLRWLLATLKDIEFEWYNRQPTGSFPNWNALKEAFLLHFRQSDFENRLREQFMRSHMIPSEAVESYYGRVANIIRRWPNNQLPEKFILLVLINGLYPPKLKMFVKKNQPPTVALFFSREKVWKECHYDRILNPSSTLILAQGTKFPNMNMTANSFQRIDVTNNQFECGNATST